MCPLSEPICTLSAAICALSALYLRFICSVYATHLRLSALYLHLSAPAPSLRLSAPYMRLICAYLRFICTYLRLYAPHLSLSVLRSWTSRGCGCFPLVYGFWRLLASASRCFCGHLRVCCFGLRLPVAFGAAHLLLLNFSCLLVWFSHCCFLHYPTVL